jgi:hypothetical protein
LKLHFVDSNSHSTTSTPITFYNIPAHSWSTPITSIAIPTPPHSHPQFSHKWLPANSPAMVHAPSAVFLVILRMFVGTTEMPRGNWGTRVTHSATQDSRLQSLQAMQVLLHHPPPPPTSIGLLIQEQHHIWLLTATGCAITLLFEFQSN